MATNLTDGTLTLSDRSYTNGMFTAYLTNRNGGTLSISTPIGSFQCFQAESENNQQFRVTGSGRWLLLNRDVGEGRSIGSSFSFIGYNNRGGVLLRIS